ncbi:unnamed protein product [Caenorhabditis sp. 36 PRJEB53466]|nr:unnamed protein product [Caenorhabditis sp. 36 PRJEB53466]
MTFLRFVLFFLCVQNGRGSAIRAKSSLGLIVDDLSILARVTNAISLQAASHRKVIKVQNVVAELLGVENGHFATVLATDIPNINSTINNLFEKSSALVDSDPTIGERIESARNILKLLVKMMDEKDTFERVSADSDTLNFFDSVHDDNQIRNVMFCEQTVLENFSEFFLDRRRTIKLLSYGLSRVMVGMGERAEELARCIENIDTFVDSFGHVPITKSLKQLEQLEHLHSVLEHFHGQQHDELEEFGAEIQKIRADLRKSEGIASTQNFKAIEAYSDSGFYHQFRESSKLTGAFRDIRDLGKVQNDLKSSWFQHKIAKNQSTSELDSALSDFFKFSVQMQKLGATWSASLEDFKKFEDNVIEVGERLDGIANFKQADDDQVLEKFQMIFKDCWGKHTKLNDSMAALVLHDFEDPYEMPFDIMEHSRSILELVKNMRLSVDMKQFVHFLRDMARLKDVIPVEDTVRRVGLFTQDPYFPSFLAVIMKLNEIFDAQRSLLKSVEKVRNSSEITADTFKLNTFMDESKALEVFECFHRSPFDAPKVGAILEFLGNVSEFANKKNVQKAQKHLENIGKVQREMKSVRESMKEEEIKGNGSLVLAFKNSEDLALGFSRGVSALSELNRVYESNETLQNAKNLATGLSLAFYRFATEQLEYTWKHIYPKAVDRIMNDLHGLMSISETLIGKDVEEMKAIFDEAKTVRGISVERKALFVLARAVKSEKYLEEGALLEHISRLKLDFTQFEADFTGAAASLSGIRDNFNELFGLVKRKGNEQIIVEDLNILAIIGICSGILMLILLGLIIGYGCTKNGRKKYRNWYLYYFPNMDEFERRWRYSLFLDRMDGKNALLEAVADSNPTNTLKALRKGAYVNVFNQNGNTALHVAANLGYWEIVAMLIKHGADREQLNYLNRTAEQAIPDNYKVSYRELAGSYDKTVEIFEKYRKKKFRIMVPEEFPTSSFHIFIEPRTEDTVTNQFMEHFEAIAFIEPSPNSTHVVVKTNADGILETDDLNLLVWIFNGAIIVKEQWMSDCLADAKLIGSDEKYVVESVRYKGLVYENAVVPWTTALAKGAMPFLYGVHLVVVMQECPNLLLIHNLVKSLGGTVLEEFPQKEQFNRGSHPYLHSNLGPIFILHDGRSDLKAYREDVDRMFTVFTEQEFIAFLLKRHVHVDTTKDLIQVLIDEEVPSLPSRQLTSASTTNVSKK